MKAFGIQWVPIPVLICALLVSGCGDAEVSLPTGTAKGTVVSQGQPLEEGQIHFYDPQRGLGAGAVIVGGNFVLEEPVPAGDYLVAVMPPAPPPPDEAPAQVKTYPEIPQRYRSTEKSGMTATVVEGQENVFEFVLER